MSELAPTPKRSVVHATFTIENVYPHSPAKVFRAFSTPAGKDAWFGGPSDWEKHERIFEFREGGRETSAGGPKGGTVHRMDLTYRDIIPGERIIYVYDMYFDDTRISSSLATLLFKPEGPGTRLSLTEYGAYLDGYDDAGGREHGTRWLLGKMGESLK
jgi:uncharacterized protein YndB with AHSA1/START domain